ncbi:hypothetical protein [Actinacidiphila guanduensis]|uniref:hypothetical protein n=1 Tax=Actinacidiphila guanduensis TaxID=310781 RepID=UPI00116007FC|nr:hypothetical protein [Actinacidiphila guanduensis]
MGQRSGLIAEIAENVVNAGTVAFVLAGLVPLLWEHDGWSGVTHRTGSVAPLSVAYALFGPLGRRWKTRRGRRRAERQQADARMR